MRSARLHYVGSLAIKFCSILTMISVFKGVCCVHDDAPLLRVTEVAWQVSQVMNVLSSLATDSVRRKAF
jgi:hypothetical protein